MGGKNPAIVLRSADLEEAAEGIMRSAFGFSGQKCSANSRVYVERPVHDELVRLLVEKTEKLVVGDPLPRTAFTGPVIDERAVNRHQQAVAEARRDGTVFTGGERLGDGSLARGYYVEPTVVGLPSSHRLFQDELFAPFTAVAPVDSLGEALALANDNIYGLTAGVYSENPAEVQRFLDEVHAGVLYVNRRAGADHRRMAGRPGVRRLEGLRLDRQVRPLDVLRRAVPPRAEPHDRRLTLARTRSRIPSPASRRARRCPGGNGPPAAGVSATSTRPTEASHEPLASRAPSPRHRRPRATGRRSSWRRPSRWRVIRASTATTCPRARSRRRASVRALPCAFTPTVAYVPVGTTVTFGNATQDVHLITGANQEWGDREAELLGNATVSYTFDQAGVFPYACALHRGMVGAIVVGADGAAGLAPQTGGAAPATAASTLRASGASGSEPALAVVAAIGAVVALGAVALVARARHRATGPGSAAAPDGATR